MTRLPPLDPAVAATRLAVRKLLMQHSESTVLVGLSGGADSLALAAAVAFEAPKCAVRAGVVIVDHGLQRGSDLIAARAAAQATALQFDPIVVRRVEVLTTNSEGPEAAARSARYAAFQEVCLEENAAALLTAHTRDDQAEQVFLAMARGSGIRALAGIPSQRGSIYRPFLGLDRASTVAACLAQGLEYWSDPHNLDPRYARVRVRESIIPMLQSELGASVTANLARTAELAREDADALDELAEIISGDAVVHSDAQAVIVASALEMLVPAIRNRVIRRVAHTVFVTWLTREHTLQIASLVTDWRGQGPIHVPGGRVSRDDGRLIFRAN